jgi:hypothetical protein
MHLDRNLGSLIAGPQMLRPQVFDGEAGPSERLAQSGEIPERAELEFTSPFIRTTRDCIEQGRAGEEDRRDRILAGLMKSLDGRTPGRTS